MPSRKTRVDRVDDVEPPLEDQPLEWEKEDVDLENRKPDLGEIEEDESQL